MNRPTTSSDDSMFKKPMGVALRAARRRVNKQEAASNGLQQCRMPVCSATTSRGIDDSGCCLYKKMRFSIKGEAVRRLLQQLEAVRGDIKEQGEIPGGSEENLEALEDVLCKTTTMLKALLKEDVSGHDHRSEHCCKRSSYITLVDSEVDGLKRQLDSCRQKLKENERRLQEKRSMSKLAEALSLKLYICKREIMKTSGRVEAESIANSGIGSFQNLNAVASFSMNTTGQRAEAFQKTLNTEDKISSEGGSSQASVKLFDLLNKPSASVDSQFAADGCSRVPEQIEKRTIQYAKINKLINLKKKYRDLQLKYNHLVKAKFRKKDSLLEELHHRFITMMNEYLTLVVMNSESPQGNEPSQSIFTGSEATKAFRLTKSLRISKATLRKLIAMWSQRWLRRITSGT